MMRGGIIALVVCVPLLLAAGGYAWMRDEPLSDEAQAWLEQAQVDSKPSQAFVYLNGLDAPAGQAPPVLGAARLAHYQNWRSQHSALDDSFRELPGPTLKLPEGSLLCAIEKDDCLAKLLRDASGHVETAEQRLLRERYWQFLQFDDYRNSQEASIVGSLPPFRYLTTGQQLFSLQLLQAAQVVENAQVQAHLDEELRLLRRQLRRADTLILKVVLARMVERNMIWQAVLYRQGLMPAPSSVPAFDEAERSLLMPLQDEFKLSAMLFQTLLEAENSWGERLMLLLGLRPQMSTNASLTFYQPMAELSRRPPEVFVGELQQLPAAQWQRSWRNPMGNLLLEIGTPDYRRYAVRLQDLEAYRRLLQGLSQLPQGAPSAEQLRAFDNPYYPGQPAQLNEQGQLCFDGPLLEDDGARCLPL